MTLSIYDLDPMSLVVEVEGIEAIVSNVDGTVRAQSGSRSSEQSHVFVRLTVDWALRQGNAEAKKAAMMSLLWLTLNHPHHAEQMRAGMSQALRERGKVHLSVTVDERRVWSFTLAGRWVDMTAVMNAIPPDQHVTLAYSEPVPAKPLQ